jgi:hypothetical protein
VIKIERLVFLWGYVRKRGKKDGLGIFLSWEVVFFVMCFAVSISKITYEKCIYHSQSLPANQETFTRKELSGNLRDYQLDIIGIRILLVPPTAAILIGTAILAIGKQERLAA